MEKQIGSSRLQASVNGESYRRECKLYSPYRAKSLMELSAEHKNSFSASMGDLSLINNSSFYHRRSVMFEEDLSAHEAILQRARSRFRELELKYPDIFKKTTPRNSSFFGANGRSSSVQGMHRVGLKTASNNVRFARSHVELETDHQRNQNWTHLSEEFSLRTRKTRPPPLSQAIRSSHLEGSCDSAFDEIESTTARITPDRSPNNGCEPGKNSNLFLYPGDSLESDKDSGISTDRPFIPQARVVRANRPVTLAVDSRLPVSKSQSLSTLDTNDEGRDVRGVSARSAVDRRGILKSAAYRNQGIKTGSLDLPHASSGPYSKHTHSNRRSRHGNQNKSEIYQRMSQYSNYGSQDEGTNSDAETIYSTQSEVLARHHLSARQQFLSTYNLDNESFESIKANRIQKAKSLPNLDYEGSTFDQAPGFRSEQVDFSNAKKKKKRILQRFGRRSGLYIVNDTPELDKPKLPAGKKQKLSKKLKKKKSVDAARHITESTKDWFDHTTAVSRPTGGQSLGRVVTMREDIGMAYEIELQKPDNGLFGFFIQKGYKQFNKGIFISRIMDSSSAKFLAGLLNPGDEVLEINGQSTKTKTTAEVHNIMASSDRLLLTVMPYTGRKDW
ncbi:predicted protein [Nematostella vectensis]|uniref:PDZ domain-containing protein n=1 Tax=Nematostella vectensis TaxID=45351 RepID=A7RYT8_NEMVE|nr:uncharacterized protein LOC5515351 [Nematostella vectensis]EDO43380.1 predicted protein [Nematostella vectensis]|eukprot:XP_001635443.1 predicted protein [Nematostella vectensis]